jgi:endothelin-converting enzyme/putative endopeptidase
MDETALATAGLSPIASLLADIDAATTPAHVQRVLRRLHDLGIAAAFGEAGGYDNSDPAAFRLQLVAGALGMRDRELYSSSEPRAAQLRESYRHHVARVLELAGTPELGSLSAADGVVAFEKRLADASLDAKTAADPAATEHPTTFAQLRELAPHVDWSAYFDEAHLSRATVNVAEPRLMRQADKELEATPVATWRNYLRWRLLEAASPSLAKAFADEAAAFEDEVLGGAATTKPRAQRCAELTESLLGEPVGRAYAARYFPAAAKAKVRAIAGALLAVLKERLAGVPWMAVATKTQALAKLDAMSVQVGYPDAWKDVSRLRIRRDALWANIAQARKLSVDDVRHQIGKPTDRNGWLLPPSSPDAYLDLQLDEIVLPAGFLQPPYFDVDATDAVNFGALGSSLAHDMTHAFDATGALLDTLGRARPWWTDTDRREFDERVRCIVDQYAGYAIEPGVHHDGLRVLNEALGDQAGIHVAYLALKRAMAAHPVTIFDGFTPEQQFFLAWGQLRGEAMRIETQRQVVQSDIHAVPKFRVIGPLSRLPEFAQAFSCRPGAPMVRPQEQRCAVW